jgi:hypothetical protein
MLQSGRSIPTKQHMGSISVTGGSSGSSLILSGTIRMTDWAIEYGLGSHWILLDSLGAKK